MDNKDIIIHPHFFNRFISNFIDFFEENGPFLPLIFVMFLVGVEFGLLYLCS